VTTTKETQKTTWAITIGQKPGLTCSTRKSERIEEPRTISGVAMGRKIRRFDADRPLNAYRPIAKAMSVPNIVEKIVTSIPILIEFPSASQTRGAAQGFNHFSKVNPCQVIFDFPESLKEKTKV
jgi:hypothetical protein